MVNLSDGWEEYEGGEAWKSDLKIMDGSINGRLWNASLQCHAIAVWSIMMIEVALTIEHDWMMRWPIKRRLVEGRGRVAQDGANIPFCVTIMIWKLKIKWFPYTLNDVPSSPQRIQLIHESSPLSFPWNSPLCLCENFRVVPPIEPGEGLPLMSGISLFWREHCGQWIDNNDDGVSTVLLVTMSVNIKLFLTSCGVHPTFFLSFYYWHSTTTTTPTTSITIKCKCK